MKIILAIFFIGLSFFVNATDYYVSKDGSDSNPGTEAEPFLTIGKAASIMVAGDICYIKEGTYRETVSPANAGSAAAPITFKAFEGDSVVISATEELGNWAQHSGTTYKAAATYNVDFRSRMLYVGGKPMDIARWPNNVDHDPYTLEANPVTINASQSRHHIATSGIPNYDWSGGYIYYLGAHSGASWTGPALSVSSSRIEYDTLPEKWPFNPHNPTVLRNGNRGQFYLFGVLDALDFEEEWYYDEEAGEIYLKAPKEGDPDTMKVEMTARTMTFNITQDYIHLDGLNMFGGMVNVAASNCVLKNNTIQYGLQVLDEMFNNNAQLNEGSLIVNGSNNLIERNLVEFGSSNGIALSEAWKGHSGNTIHNNIIRFVNTIGNHSSPIRAGQTNAIITNNTIYSTGRDGLYINGNNSVVAYNDVYDCMKINNDGGIFYVVGNENDKNTVIHHNWFHDSEGPDYADGRVAAIYLDNDSKGYLVHHNVVWDVTWTGIQINWDNWNIDIYHNTIFDAHDGAMGRWENGRTIEDIVVRNNYASSPSDQDQNDNQQYVINGWIGTDVPSSNNIINSTFQFRSLDAPDFRPLTGSTLIDRGVEISGINDDFVGDAPDVGAYESGGELWIAGADWEAYKIAEEPVLSALPTLKTVVYPNPATNKISVSGPEVESYAIIDTRGTVVLRGTFDQYFPREINLGNLRQGFYLVKVKAKSGEVHTKPIIKN
ncbi:MAG: T9SS type A sorting domain-containing protein [Bacteroidota bacterium]